MPYKIVRKASLCKECPLQHEAIHKCYGISDIQNPKIAFIGEAPGRKEDEMGIPFVGSSGAMLNGTVAEIGKKFYQAHKTNVILCRPPKNNIESFEAQEAITCCRAGFIEELNVLKRKGTKVLMAVGGTALTALNIEGTISKNRGSVYMLKLSEKDIKPITEGPFDFVCIPTFHPSFLFRGQLKHEVSFINDIEKAYSLVDTPYVPPKENFKMFPTISYIEKEVDKIIKNKTLIGVDIESTGLVPGKARILMVGIATSGEDAFTIPFSKQGGSDYWKTPQERMRAHTALQKLMDKAPTVFQNCLFDMRHLEHFGCPVNNLKHDTMILHHCLTGDTEVDTLEWGRIPISQLEGKRGFHVISWDGEKLVPGKVKKCWSSGLRTDLVRVSFWNKSRIDKSKMWIDCTQDHEFPVQGCNEKIEAKNLKPGMRLVPGQTNKGMLGENTIHRWVYEYYNGSLGDNQVHHLDGNHYNNSPKNLKAVTRSEHNNYHTSSRYKATATMIRNAYQRRDRLVDNTQVKHLYYNVKLSYREVAEELNCAPDLVIAILKHDKRGLRSRSEATKLRWEKARNCRVISVTPLKSEPQIVYDMEVETTHYFSANGVIVSNCISPELPHNLGYIVSVYGKTPYWKDEVLAAPDRMINMDDEKVRTYNLRDSVVLLQILPELIKEAKEDGTYWIYENISMPLVKPVMALMGNGIMLDKKKLETWKREIKSKIESFSKDLVKYGSLPENFNLSSGDHMRCLLYGEMPARIERLEKELQKYSDNPKLRKDTKKYKEIVNGLELFKNIKPFPRLRHTIKKTETGGLSVDDEAILNLQVACNNRLKELRNLKRKKAEHETEKTSLDNLVKFIAAYREYTTYEKLNSTYTNFPVDQDNRVRFPYRITGTNTGRFASGDKKSGEAGNAQNIPDPAKHIFVAPTGKILLYGDYSNLELRVTAHVTGDKPLINIFDSGLKVHKENQKVMFGLPEDHELYKEAYRACKTYIFGRGYGGGLRGIYTRLVKAVPELNLTFEKFCKVDAAYKNAHPTIIKWEDKTRETVRETRCLTNAFGRKRYFLGSGAEIEREGLNFPIQCLGFGTKILNKNLEWVNVEDAQIGDKLVAFDETLLKNAGAPHRKWRIATITHCQHDIEYVYEILFDDTTKVYATGEHKWLCYPYNAKRDGCAWVRTDELVENKTTIPKVFDVWETDKSKSAGYLAGAFDADGTLYQTGTHTAVQFCQVENVVLKKVEEFLKEKRFDYHITKCTAEGKRKFNYVWNSLYIKGGIPEQLRFLGQIRPYRLLERFDLLNMSRRFVNSGRKARKVIKVTALHSKRPIVKIATDTKTFFANGMPTHNSTAADIVNFSLIRVQKAIDSGLLKSKMVLTVHDSIMFETPDKLLKKEAKIIKALMEEPVKINNKKVIFPVEFEIGKDWGNMKEYKI